MDSSIDDPSKDAQVFKASMRAQWDAAAAGWNAHAADISAWLHKPTDAMVRMAGVRPGAHVLDVAAGAGDQTLALAQAVSGTDNPCWWPTAFAPTDGQSSLFVTSQERPCTADLSLTTAAGDHS